MSGNRYGKDKVGKLNGRISDINAIASDSFEFIVKDELRKMLLTVILSSD
jgi:hypothetical protein